MKISRIAVGIDFQPRAELAAKEALAIARHCGSELVLLHITTMPDLAPVYPEWNTMTGAAQYRSILKQRAADAHDKLGELRTRLSGQGVTVSMAIKDNTFPDSSLVAAAVDLHADLLVVGTEGRSGFGHATAGSVAEGVVRRAPMPVVVARGVRDPIGQYQKLLVPTDFSPAARRAFELALALAARPAQIDVVHAVDTDIGGNALADELEPYAIECAQKLFTDYAQNGVEYTFHFEHGKPRAAILHRAAGADLIVMGSHGRRGFARLFLGSVATNTVRHAPCSVATIHPLES